MMSVDFHKERPAAMAASDIVSIHLRLPKGLHKRLQKDADRSGNSLNSEIVSQLESYGPALDEAIADLKRTRAKYEQLEAVYRQHSGELAQLAKQVTEISNPARIHDAVKTSIDSAMQEWFSAARRQAN
jgi:exonuclease VII small subunit